MLAGRIVADGSPGSILSRALVSGVFGVDLPLSQPPGGETPYILPQHHAGRLRGRGGAAVASAIL